MHQYNQEDHQLLIDRAQQFKSQVSRYQDGQLDPELFQQLRLRNGLYKELHAHMLRIAIPYGTINSAQLNTLADIAEKFDRGYGHFTTRQNIQFNWVELDEVPEILRELALVDMHAIQTSGSCIRNISSDHLAGIAADEVVDPRPWCELIRRWSLVHPEFNWLPRKFKFAVTGAKEDRAAIKLHDIGIKLFHDSKGETKIEVWVGGGMGRTPVVAKLLHPALAPADLLTYLQATLRVYNLHGRRDNKYKARIKILVNSVGIEAFAEQVDEQWRSITETNSNPSLTLLTEQLQTFKRSFDKPLSDTKAKHLSVPVQDNAFIRWCAQNTEPHQLDDYRIVHIPLKKNGQKPGNVSAEQMRAISLIAANYSQNEVRTTHRQNLVLPYIKQTDLYEVWSQLEALGLAIPNLKTLTDLICCPGLDYCSLANAHTIPIARALQATIESYDQLYDIGAIKLNMSGCVNACAHHHAGEIGILGVDKRGSECYQIMLGGSSGNDTRLAQRLGGAIACDDIVDAIELIIKTYVSLRTKNESFKQTVERTGIEPFKENVYAAY